MKINGKLKIDNEVEKALRKSKNKRKHVTIVAEPTKREKQILRGEKPENYVNYKNSPMSLVIQLSRQAKLAKINEEYNKEMSIENDLKLNSRNNENLKTNVNIVEKINKKEKDKEKAKDNNKNNIKNERKEKVNEKYIKIKILDSNSNNGKIENKNDLENKNYNKRTKNNYIEKINTESNNYINKTPKINEKRNIKYKRPFLGEMLDENKVFEFKKPILTQNSELIVEKKDKKINSSIDKRLFELDYNREDYKSTTRKQIERLRNNDKNIQINSFVKSASNLTNIIKEDKNRKNNKILIKDNHNKKNNNSNNNEKNNKIYNMINNRNSNFNRSHRILLLNNNRSSINLFNNFISDKKNYEIKRTDTKVYFKQRPEIISESMKNFNTYNINSNQDINIQRTINSRNYRNNNVENSKNLNEKEKRKTDDNNNKKENSRSKRRKYELHNKDQIENKGVKNIIKEENKDIMISRKGTRRNKNNVIISKYSTLYDNSQIDKNKKLEENVIVSYKSIEKKNTKGNLNKAGSQINHKDIKEKMGQIINNKNNNISNNRKHNIKNEGKSIIIPLNRKYLNHSFDFSKRNINENNNKKINNENNINMKEENSIIGRYANLKNLKVNNKLFENNYNLFDKNYVLDNIEKGEGGKKSKYKKSP